MPALANARHERFAQELAKGKSQAEAYVEAGYKPSRSASTRLAADVSICERLTELQNKVAEKTVITVAGITERLLKIAAKGETSDEAPLLAVARASLMDAAKLNGLVVDKSLTATTSLEELLDRIDGADSPHREPEATSH
jgi:hypothetical protein